MLVLPVLEHCLILVQLLLLALDGNVGRIRFEFIVTACSVVTAHGASMVRVTAVNCYAAALALCAIHDDV